MWKLPNKVLLHQGMPTHSSIRNNIRKNISQISGRKRSPKLWTLTTHPKLQNQRSNFGFGRFEIKSNDEIGHELNKSSTSFINLKKQMSRADWEYMMEIKLLIPMVEPINMIQQMEQYLNEQVCFQLDQPVLATEDQRELSENISQPSEVSLLSLVDLNAIETNKPSEESCKEVTE
jgi:hypothetical protein